MNSTCTCGCCEGIAIAVPQITANRPGLPALAYRVGTHATFLETMIARMSSQDFPALAALKTRDPADPSIALLDSWALVADVLTFYQERIANEGYLRTATERRSILQLARLIGYKLRPGVAASVYLAYTLDEDRSKTPPAPTETIIPAGARSQSVPGPGQLPQSFETSDDLDARSEWNDLKPRLTQPQIITLDSDPDTDAATRATLYFEGISNNLKPGDALLIVLDDASGHQFLRFVAAVDVQADQNRSEITLQQRPIQSSGKTAFEIASNALKPFAAEAADLFPKTNLAGQVAGLLQGPPGGPQGLLDILTPKTDPTTAANLVKGLVRQVEEKLALAAKRKATRLGPWLTQLLDTLNSVAPAIEALAQTSSFASSATEKGAIAAVPKAVQRVQSGSTSALDVLEALLEPLSRAPSVQPPNSLQLNRTVAGAFSSRSDTAPQLLSAFHPSAAPQLYQAWQNSPPLPIEVEVYALRVKAAPFGGNAPLKPITDDQGRVVGSMEWPINGSLKVGVELGNRSQSANLSITNNGQAASATVALESTSQTINLGGNTVNVTLAYDANENLTGFVFEFLGISTVTVNPLTNLGQSVTADSDAQQTVSRGAVVEYSTSVHDVAIVLSNDGATLAVTVDTLLPPDPKVVFLDAQYDQIAPGENSWATLVRVDQSQPLSSRIDNAQTISKADYGITGKSTRLTLKDPWLDPLQDRSLAVLRGTTVFAQSEPLGLAEEPLDAYLQGDTIDLEGVYDGLKSGRWIIVSGERTDLGDVTSVQASELVMVSGITQDNSSTGQVHTLLTLANKLAYTYDLSTVTIYGNVVKATHGETRNEVLGNGDSSQSFQQFKLKQKPLTFVPASNPAGTDSTLEVYVNNVEWHEIDTLAGLGAKDRNYITQTADDDTTTLSFGNGRQGARLPTGTGNVTAIYRNGIGQPGNVDAGQISLLQTRPLNVKAVINPLRASGGADRDTRDQARRNAPLAVMALDRLVSIQDYADFARTFAGIGKASSTRLSDGQRDLVHVTVAGAEDVPIDYSSDLYANLVQALQINGDPYLPLQVAIRRLRLIVISASVKILPDYLWEPVATAVRSALANTFGFDNRDLGQTVFRSEVVSVIQGVAGAAYVDLQKFDSVPEDFATARVDLAKSLKLRECIPAALARPNPKPVNYPTDSILAAELVYLTSAIPDTLILNQVKS